MSKFAILRTAKLKTMAKITMAGNHNSRDMDVPNADPNGKIELLMGSNNPEQLFREKAEEHGLKIRKNGVLAFELLLTYSPEMKGNLPILEWKEANIEWIKKKYGEDRVLSAHLHLDETTPHIQVLIMPLVKKKFRGEMRVSLSCRDFLGGHKKLSALQTNYANAMAQFGLVRGIPGSRAKHVELKSWYGKFLHLINSATNAAKADADKLFDEKPSVFNIGSWFKKTKKATEMALSKAFMFNDTLEKMGIENGRLTKQIQRMKHEIKHSQANHLQEQLDIAEGEIGELIDELKITKSDLDQADELSELQKSYIDKQGREIKQLKEDLSDKLD